MQPRRVAVFGNMNNYPVILAEGLRALGCEVDFYVNRTEPMHRPESRDPSLAGGYPDWIHDVSAVTDEDFAFRTRPFLDLVAALRAKRYDLHILNDFGISLSEYLPSPQVAFLTGSDITYLASFDSLELRSHAWQPEFRRSLEGAWSVRRFGEYVLRQRFGLQRATVVCGAAPGLMPDADAILDSIGVARERRHPLPLSDTGRVTPAPWPAAERLTILNGARIQWMQTADEAYSSTDLKGTDRLLEGFAAYRRAGGSGELRMVRKGPDVAAAESLIATLGVNDAVTWLEPMPLDAYRAEVAAAHIVCDGIGCCAGMVTRDGCAQGRPVLGALGNAEWEPVLGEPMPGLEAHTAEQVAARLLWAEKESAALQAMGGAARTFVERTMSPERVARRILELTSTLRA